MALAFKSTYGARAQWHECDTPTDYLIALLNWCDSASNVFAHDQRLVGVVGSALQDATVVRAHRLRLLGDRVKDTTPITVTSWLSRVGIRSYDMSHEIFESTTRRPIAVLTSTLVVVRGGRSTALANLEALQQFAFPSGISIPELASERPTSAHVHTFDVRPSDIDANNHVHNAKYVGFLHNATVDALRAAALPKEYALHIPNTLYIDYVASAVAHDLIELAVWQPTASNERALAYQMQREGQTLLRASVTFKESAPSSKL